jgi:hypothetical protein
MFQCLHFWLNNYNKGGTLSTSHVMKIPDKIVYRENQIINQKAPPYPQMKRDFEFRKSSRKTQSPISGENTADFLTSIQKIYSPEELLTLPRTFAKLTHLIRPSTAALPKVSDLISVMEVLRLHLPLLRTLMSIYVSLLPRLFQNQ